MAFPLSFSVWSFESPERHRKTIGTSGHGKVFSFLSTSTRLVQMNVMNIFESMDYGLSPESRTEADQWLGNRGKKFGHYIAGEYRQSTKPNYFTTYNPATGEELAQIASGTKEDVDKAVDAAVKAQKKWNKIGGYQRAKYLYAIARSI
ncbi:MAG: aldehyde dehydrogenase family protein, partial [Rhodobacteraceae bacterium]|nr:aldehyde dehydrogenase family protein [Paracoccaceae bacterium]